MIRVKKFPTQTISHYDPNDKLLGSLNEDESLHLRIQIVEEKADGYYVLFDEKKLIIDPITGFFSPFPNGLYDTSAYLCRQLHQIRVAIDQDMKTYSWGK